MHHQIDKPVIEISHVSFSYPERLVLSDISLTIHEGDFLGIVGPNGGGKTTLLRLVLGLLSPQHGTIRLFGTPISEFRDWHRIGYVPQRIGSFDPLFPITVRETVEMGLTGKLGFFKTLGDDERQTVAEMIELVGLQEFSNTRIGNLSGGQIQRTLIARALVGKPDILFLDEPTTGVDAPSQEQFFALVRSLHTARNISLVLVSHDLDVVAKETTEVACINETLVFHGDPKDFVESDRMDSLYGTHKKIVRHHHHV